jgi:succinyl-CoA synthetase beta subunit
VELHEYQIKSLLSRYGVQSPPHIILEAGCDVHAALSTFGVEPLAIKAQVHGSRRKEGGGEKFTRRPKDLVDAAASMLGSQIVTSTSGPQGFTASKVMVMSIPSIAKQYQIKAWVDDSGDFTLSACQIGEKSVTERPFDGYIRSFQLNRLTSALGLRGERANAFKKCLEGILRMFFHFDALFIEINPLALTESGLFQVLDVRMAVDDRALYRQLEVQHMVDHAQGGPRSSVLPYSLFDMGGPIACVANGHALALSTADLICRLGGLPGRIVNIGSTVTAKGLVKGITMAWDKPSALVLINLFTGLVDGEIVTSALKNECTSIPMIVRLEGTNAVRARQLVKDLRSSLVATSSLEEAAKLSVMNAARHT